MSAIEVLKPNKVKGVARGGKMSEISDFLKEMDRVDKWWNKKGEELARQKHEENRGIKYD